MNRIAIALKATAAVAVLFVLVAIGAGQRAS